MNYFILKNSVTKMFILTCNLLCVTFLWSSIETAKAKGFNYNRLGTGDSLSRLYILSA